MLLHCFEDLRAVEPAQALTPVNELLRRRFVANRKQWRGVDVILGLLRVGRVQVAKSCPVRVPAARSCDSNEDTPLLSQEFRKFHPPRRSLGFHNHVEMVRRLGC